MQWNLNAAYDHGLRSEVVFNPQYRNLLAFKLPKIVDRPIIAIIDNGCDVFNPVIKKSLWNNKKETDCYDLIDNDGNGKIDDCLGWNFIDNNNDLGGKLTHGSPLAGIMVGRCKNPIFRSICPHCHAMCLKFISEDKGVVSNQLKALNYAIRNGAKISNHSYGSYELTPNQTEYRAFKATQDFDHLIITSAGNKGIDLSNSKKQHYPSGFNLPNMISVGASNIHGRRSFFSNYGKDHVSVFAPGENIYSISSNGYTNYSGTSFAAPHIAGLAGLIWSIYPQLTNLEVKEAILSSCKMTSNLKDSCACRGVADTVNALKYANSLYEKKFASLNNSTKNQNKFNDPASSFLPKKDRQKTSTWNTKALSYSSLNNKADHNSYDTNRIENFKANIVQELTLLSSQYL